MLCESLSMDCSCGKRLPVADAFKSATGDVRDRITVRRDGEQKFYQIYCRENQSTPNVLLPGTGEGNGEPAHQPV